MNPIMEVKKPLRAKKTMTPSSRKQVKMLNEMKAVQTAEKLANGTSVVDNHVHLKRAEASGLCQNSLKEHSLQPESKQTLLDPPTLRESVTNLVVNSEISIYDSSHKGSKDLPYKVGRKDSNLEQFLNGGALHDILYQYLQKEPNSLLQKPVEVHLNSEPLAQLSGQSLSVTPPMRKGKETEINDETLVKRTMPVLEKEGDKSQLLEKNTNSSVLPDRTQRKRRPSETSEEPFSKCIKKSDEAREVCNKNSEKRHFALEQVKSFVQSQLDNSMKTMDDSLELLKQRIDRTQCLQKHEAIAIKIVKKISRLDRRLDAVIAYQKRGSSRKALPTRAPSQDEMLRCPNPQHGSANSTPAPSKETPPSVTVNKTVPINTESSEDVICLSGAEKISDVGMVNLTGVQQKEASVNATPSAETPCNSQKLLLIDLTAEGDDSKTGTGKEKEKSIANKANSAVESLAPSNPQPVLQSSNQDFEQFRHLPPLPPFEPQPESFSRIRYTLPPQKLKLVVAEVESPKGFALQWDVSKVEPYCAPLDSFHVYVYLEPAGKSGPSSWVKVSEIAAMPLPMACSLTHKSFLPGTTCYFVIAAKDIYGRYGPPSDIQSISAT